jgi:hypothetical protein
MSNAVFEYKDYQTLAPDDELIVRQLKLQYTEGVQLDIYECRANTDDKFWSRDSKFVFSPEEVEWLKWVLERL